MHIQITAFTRPNPIAALEARKRSFRLGSRLILSRVRMIQSVRSRTRRIDHEVEVGLGTCVGIVIPDGIIDGGGTGRKRGGGTSTRRAGLVRVGRGEGRFEFTSTDFVCCVGGIWRKSSGGVVESGFDLRFEGGLESETTGVRGIGEVVFLSNNSW